ncbi:alpha/beta fold hydrolase [Streptosporangium saharense]|uniref:Pimeloyl-ACP methyl ester carboxylesterase n=1 Tax=Streptosporangium saharense TaxID=1706840 RepID=A0A7W7QMN3_9ACTN|nr:alpha/beta hydrolase [Streptosporangium saharense]MBB4915836.1 pimeloyl-ACP methyl ester carboxylesterase [Streptosporangium saharense]
MNTSLHDAALAHSLEGSFSSRHARVNGVGLHYVEGGEGEPLLLLGGWPQTWWQWHKVMPALARRHRVIAVDLRGMGGSDKPDDGYDKRTMAEDIHALVRHLGLETVSVVGHDIGAMVAYAFAANHPEAVDRIALLDVAHPDETWTSFGLLPGPDQHVGSVIEAGARPYLWWFAFNQVRGLPEQLLDGRSRLLVDWLFDRQAKDPATIDEHSRRVYAHAYSTADAVRAGNGWYQTFNRDIEDERTYGRVKTPMLVLGGDESNHAYLSELMPSKGTDVTVVEVAACGHYVPEEQPQAVIDALTAFLY